MTDEPAAVVAEPVGAVEETTTSQVVTEGSAASAEAGEASETNVVDEWLKTYGEQKEEVSTPETKPEAKPEVVDTPDPEPTQDQDEDKFVLSKDEWKTLSPKVQQRIGHLSKVRRELAAENGRLSADMEGYTADRSAMNAMHTYMRENDLSQEDVSRGFSLMAAAKRDPEAFLTGIMPVVEAAQLATGKALAPEVKKLVEAGDMTMEAGLELTRARVSATAAAAKAQSASEQLQQRDAREAQAQAVASLARAVRETETVLRAQDPGYALKEQAIQRQFLSTVQHLKEMGAMPKTAAQVSKIIRDIHANIVVNMPAQQRAGAAASETAPPSPQRRPEPRTQAELLEQALEDFNSR